MAAKRKSSGPGSPTWYDRRHLAGTAPRDELLHPEQFGDPVQPAPVCRPDADPIRRELALLQHRDVITMKERDHLRVLRRRFQRLEAGRHVVDGILLGARWSGNLAVVISDVIRSNPGRRSVR